MMDYRFIMINRSTLFVHKCVLFVLAVLCFSLWNVNASAVEVSAEGSNQRQALNAALRQAVEMSLGTEIETNTLVENFQVVRQQILNHTKGFVRSYKILSEDISTSGLVRITIDADVDDQSIQDSTKALSTLMKMAAHPRIYVAGIDADFDAISSISDEFRLLTEMVEATLRDEFHFEILENEAVRLADITPYRFTDRKNNLKRARRAKAEFIVFVQVLRGPHGQSKPLTLRLETLEVATNRSIAKEEVPFSMKNWTRIDQQNRETIINEAKDHIYAPSALLAARLIETLRQEVYEDGQRYDLSFYRFDEKNIQFLETDLATLSGYVRHKLVQQKKTALTLSYWSLLKAGPLHEEISSLLKGQDIPFTFKVKGRTIKYQYDDPMFE